MNLKLINKVNSLTYDNPLDGLVMFKLSVFADRNYVCFQSQGYLSDSIGVSQRTVRRSVSRLKARGYIKVNMRGDRRSSIYDLSVLFKDDTPKNVIRLPIDDDQPFEGVRTHVT